MSGFDESVDKGRLSEAPALRSHSLALFLIIAIGVTLIVAVLLIARIDDVPLKFYTRDPASTTQENSLLGVLSNAGLVFWSAAATVSLFVAFATPVRRRFFVYAGLFSILLLADDAAMLHEGPFRWHLGVSETMVFTAYGLLAILFMMLHRETLTGRGRGLFFAAAACFALSVLLDVFFDTDEILVDAAGEFIRNDETLGAEYEDLPKFLGIVLWFAYLFDQALRTLRPLLRA